MSISQCSNKRCVNDLDVSVLLSQNGENEMKKTQKQFLFDSDTSVLYLNQDKDKEMVTLKKCFPWSEGASFFSVRNAKDDEVAFITKLEELSASDYQAIARYFESHYSQFTINKLISVDEEYDLRLFKLKLNLGNVAFKCELMIGPIILSEGRILLYDINGDFYVIEDLKKLTTKEQKTLSYLID